MSVIEQFKLIADRYPDRVALCYYTDRWQSLSYAALEQQARFMACDLHDAGVQPGDAVILPSLRTPELVPQLLATLWVGAHYVFIDPNYPLERQQLIQSQSKACWGLAKASFGADFFSQEKISWIDTNTETISERNTEINKGIRSIADVMIAGDCESPAYIMFTSGSTGQPKGVVVPQRAITRLVNNTNYIDFSPEQRFLQHSNLSFDASTLELWGPLLNGGTCVIYPQQWPAAPVRMAEVIAVQGVTTLWLTSSFFNYFITELASGLQPLQQLLIGGEAISPKHIQQAQSQLPQLQLFNGYGPTENTTFSTVYPISRAAKQADWDANKAIPIGFAINGTECEVFDEQLKPLADGEPGELLVFGDGLALGYLNRDELTAEKFIDVQRSSGNVERGYRTGDWVRMRGDGAFEYLGRQDKQVKIDGHRIELGEIETRLLALAGIKTAAVVVKTDSRQQKRIAAYIVSDEFSATAYRQALAAVLPEFMIPHFFIAVSQLPFNQNGKLDEQALADPFVTDMTAAEQSYQSLDENIALCWSTVLGRQIARHTNFLDAGGTSLEAVKLAAALSNSLGVELADTFVFQYSSIAAQEAYFSNAKNPHSDSNKQAQHGAVTAFAVIGMACRLPGANNVEQFWQNLLDGKENISFFDQQNLSPEVPASMRSAPNYVAAKGVIEDVDKFDARFFGVSPLEASLTDPQQRIMLELAWHALEHAGYSPGVNGLGVGVFAGSNWSRYYQQYVLPNQDLLNRFGAFNAALANESDFLSTRISYKLNLQGPSVNVYTACSTGLVAIAQACAAIEQGQCDMALAGGVSIATPINAGYLYQEGGMLARDGHCRPFDAEASGTTFNDGAGFVVVKRLDLAERDGDIIHAVVKGYSVNNDGGNKASYTAPSINGQLEVYRQALAKAAVPASSIGYIETHGTATPLGDPIEVDALRQAYVGDANADAGFRCAIGSVKSNIGHVIHAAGVASFIKSVCAVREGKIPATVHFNQANSKLKLEQTPFYVNQELQPWDCDGKRRAAVSSLGVGGTNAHVIVEQYQRAEQTIESKRLDTADSELYPVLISAKSAASLQAQIKQYQHYFQTQPPQQSICDSAYTSACCKPGFPYRAAFAASTNGELVDKLSAKRKKASAVSEQAAATDVAFLFTGQGAQRVGMGQWLYQHDSSYRQLFDQGAEILQAEFGYDLTAIVFDLPSQTHLVSDTNGAGQWDINQTAIAQPALFLLELGLAQWFQRKGLTPASLIGHSIGEYAAAVVAGVLSFSSALRMVAKRGQLMQQQAPGDMVAVKASLDVFADLLDDGLGLAAQNAPELNVISGPVAAMNAIKQALDKRAISYTALITSHAFHSSMMEPMLQEFEQYISSFEFSAPVIPIYSTSTGKCLTADEAMSPRYWVEQIRRPVLYANALQSAVSEMSAAAIALLELGPGTTLSSLARMQAYSKTLVTQSALPLAGVDHNAIDELHRALAVLWENGAVIDWSLHFPDCDRHSRVNLPLYPFVRDRHWLALPPSVSAMPAVSAGDLQGQLQQLHQLQQQLLSMPALRSAPVTISQNQANSQEQTHTQEKVMSSTEHLASVSQKLIAVFEDITGYDLQDLEPNAFFSEAGLDSLLLTQVAIALDQQFGGGITFRNLIEDYTCLAELADFYSDIIPVETTTLSSGSTAAAATNAATNSVTNVAKNVAIHGGTVNGGLSELVTAQLQIMQMQLQALSGAAAVNSVSESAVNNTAGLQASADHANINTGAGTELQAKSEKAASDTALGKNRSRHSPGAKITKQSVGVELSSAQQEWLNEKMIQFQQRFAKSKAYAQDNRKQLADPRTVSGFNPEWKELVFPIVTKASKGSKLWDIDDNELIDITNGFGPILFGHSPDFVTEAVKKQMDLGVETGPQSPMAGEVAQLFCELTGNERCSFASTGSEAVIGAIRLARTVTGRKTVVMFEGAYHGIFDEVITRPGKDYQALPAAPGISREMTSNMLVLPWGKAESIDVIRELGRGLAAVLVEPVQSRKPGFNDASYIQQLRSVTREYDAALILDEVVTGFRVAPGGIRERFNIDADLATYGKVVGGGYPIGIIGGSARFMDALDGGYWEFGDTSIPEVGVTFFAGTFVRHPLSLAAAKSVMLKIKQSGQSLYDELEQKTAKISNEANAFIKELSCDVNFEHFASLFYVSVPSASHWGHMFYTLMLLEGVYIQQYRPSFLTTAHSEQDVDKILAAFKRSLALMVEHGLIEGDMLAAKKFLNDKQAIPEGARLGRNEKGEPAYFIEDPDNSGQFIEVGKP